MNALNSLLDGFGTALTPINLLWAAIGVLLGTAIGVLPGIGPAITGARSSSSIRATASWTWASRVAVAGVRVAAPWPRASYVTTRWPSADSCAARVSHSPW